jgi:RecA/RadA recombinase
MSENTQVNARKASKLKARAPESVKAGKIKAVLYGPSGVGKTTLALSFPAPYYFDVEGGAKGPQYRKLLADSGGVYMGPEDGTMSFDTLIEQMQALATEKHPYKTLIVDSLTKLFQSTIASEAERLGDKDAFGASKKPAIAAMRRLVLWASRLDMNIWFICHEATEWGVVNGQRSEIGKVADVWDKLIYELDLAIQCNKRGPSRMATVKKSRLLAYPDADTFPLDYAEFIARHGKETIEGEVGVTTLATPEQVSEVAKLLSLTNVADTDISKGFAKAGVESWAEMTGEQISKWLEFLRKRVAASVPASSI